MSAPHILKPSHIAAIRLIFLGMSVKEAAQHIGVSRVWMSTIYHSEAGKAYLKHLMDKTDQYAAALVALGLMPADIVGNEKPVEPRPFRDIRHTVVARNRFARSARV